MPTGRQATATLRVSIQGRTALSLFLVLLKTAHTSRFPYLPDTPGPPQQAHSISDGQSSAHLNLTECGRGRRPSPEKRRARGARDRGNVKVVIPPPTRSGEGSSRESRIHPLQRATTSQRSAPRQPDSTTRTTTGAKVPGCSLHQTTRSRFKNSNVKDVRTPPTTLVPPYPRASLRIFSGSATARHGPPDRFSRSYRFSSATCGNLGDYAGRFVVPVSLV